MHLLGCLIENFTATPGMATIPGVAFLFILEQHLPCFSRDKMGRATMQIAAILFMVPSSWLRP